MIVTKRLMDVIVSYLVENNLTLGLEPNELGKYLYKHNVTKFNRDNGELKRVPRYEWKRTISSDEMVTSCFHLYFINSDEKQLNSKLYNPNLNLREVLDIAGKI
jgi:hypothetical protein